MLPFGQLADDSFIGIEQALQVALDAQTAGLGFYADVLENTKDPNSRCWSRSSSRRNPSK